MKVKYCGPARDYSGYGEANRHDIAALIADGIEVTTQIPQYTQEISDFGKIGELASSLEHKPLGYHIKIIHTTPNVYRSFMEPEKYHIGRLFWETDKIPLDFAQSAELMNEIWTGSRFNMQAIRNAGVTKPIYVIPEAIDTELAQNIEPFEIPDKEFYKFYSIFEWTERKNPTALLTAFWQEFEGVKDVSLTIKTYVDNFTPDKNKEIDSYIRRVKHNLPQSHYPAVKLSRVLMDRHQVYRFHKTFDCFVSSHRGEGWGIPQMEALLMGNPIISTNLGGIHEYLIDGIHGKLVPFTMVPIGENSRNKQWYTPDQKWAEVSISELRIAMRYMYDHRSEAKQMGENGHNLVESLFSLKSVGEKMRERLTQISNEPYEMHREEPEFISSSVPNLDHLQIGDIIEPEHLEQDIDANGKVHSQFMVPALVKKNRIKVDYNARQTGDPSERT